jgi:hypothetical protein
MREPRPRHTLQVIRVPSLEVQNLGLTSFDSWLDENGYDKTNAGNNRTIWARESGWYLKRCRNLKTGTDDFWFIAFDGKGGNLYPLKPNETTGLHIVSSKPKDMRLRLSSK